MLLLDDVSLFLQDEVPPQTRFNAFNSVFRFRLAQSKALVFMTAVDSRPPDNLFMSHISVPLRLQGFNSDPPCQRALWRSAIQSLGGELRPDTELNMVLNKLLTCERAQSMDGRQIHACVRAAVALARQRGFPVDHGHITEVIGLAEDFRNSFKESPHSPVAWTSVERHGGEQGAL